MQGLDLDRATDHGRIAGVCAGVADRWRIDPLLVRVGAVILALCSGIGAVLYGAAWLLLPAKGETDGPLMTRFPRTKQVPAPLWYVIVGALGLTMMGMLGPVMPISTGPVIAVAALWYFGIYRPGKRRAQNARAAADPAMGGAPSDAPPHSSAPGGHPADASFTPYDPQPRFGTGIEPEGYPDQWPAAGTPPMSDRPAGSPEQPAGSAPAGQPSMSITRTGAVVGDHAQHARRVRTIAIMVVAAAVIALGVLDGTGLVTVPLLGYAATALLIVGVALVVSAWTGRARGLLPLGCLLLALTVVGMGAVMGDSDNPRWTQVSSYSTVEELPGPLVYDLAEVRTDLAGIDLDRDATYSVAVDSGTIVVTVPRDANVVVHATVDVGTIKALEQQRQGTDLTGTFSSHPDPGGPVLTLDLTVDVGSVTVVRS